MALELQHSSRGGNQALVACCIAAALLQVAVAPQLSLFGGRVNFMLALIATCSIGSDPRTMVYAGFAAGLFYDLTSTAPVGLMALMLTLVGFALATMTRGLTTGLGMESLRLVAAAVVIVNLLNGVLLVVMGIEGSLLYSLGVHALASCALTLIACVPFLALQGGGGSRGGRGRALGTVPGARRKVLH